MFNSELTCLRQGYKCTCTHCQQWIKLWEREERDIAYLNELISNMKSLFLIFEELRRLSPNLLRYYTYIEKRYFEVHYGVDGNPLTEIDKFMMNQLNNNDDHITNQSRGKRLAKGPSSNAQDD